MRLQQSPVALVRLLQSELHNFSSVAELHNISGIAGNCRVLIIDIRRILFNNAVLASAVKCPNVDRSLKAMASDAIKTLDSLLKTISLKSETATRDSSWMSRRLRLEVYCGGFSGGSTQRCRL